MPLRFIAGRSLRELIGVVALSMMALPGVAVAQDVAVSLDELLRSGSLQPGEGVYVTDAAGRRPEGHAQRRVVNRVGGHASRSGVDGGRCRCAGNRSPGFPAEWHRVRHGGGRRPNRRGVRRGVDVTPAECAYVLLYVFPVVAIGSCGGRCRGRSQAQDDLPRCRVSASIRVTDRVTRESRRTRIGRLVNRTLAAVDAVGRRRRSLSTTSFDGFSEAIEGEPGPEDVAVVALELHQVHRLPPLAEHAGLRFQLYPRAGRLSHRSRARSAGSRRHERAHLIRGARSADPLPSGRLSPGGWS